MSMKTRKTKKIKYALKQVVVLYHADCPDGFGAAWAAWKKFGARASYIPVHHHESLPKGIHGKEVYMVDFTYPASVIKKLMRENIRVTAIDHHISTKETTLMTHKSLYALHHSGAVLSWMYFHPKKKLPTLLRYIEDRDIWNWKLPHAKEILLYADLVPHEFAKWSTLVRYMETVFGRKKARESGGWMLKYHNDVVKKIAEKKEMVKFEGHLVYAVNAPHIFASDVGALLCKETEFAIIWSEYEGDLRVSLRSRGRVDVSKIAAKYGGGGHRAAAGFSVQRGKKAPWRWEEI